MGVLHRHVMCIVKQSGSILRSPDLLAYYTRSIAQIEFRKQQSLLRTAYDEVAASIRRGWDIESKLLTEVQPIKREYHCFICANKHRDLQCLPSVSFLGVPFLPSLLFSLS